MTSIQSLTTIVRADRLTKKDLLDLIQGQILALRIPNLVSSKICSQWQSDLQYNPHLSPYSNATDVAVNRIGMTLFETENQAKKIRLYLDQAPKVFPIVEQIFKGDNPIQAIHSTLSDAWKRTCTVAQLHQQMMSPGIIRAFEADPKGGLPPHVDSLLKDVPTTDTFAAMQCQLAANLYFSTSEQGGELELWDYAPTLDELPQLYNGAYDFIDRTKIFIQSQLLKPQVGELILFRSNCIHSVRPSQGGMRAAASCFVGYYEENAPLTVWA